MSERGELRDGLARFQGARGAVAGAAVVLPLHRSPHPLERHTLLRPLPRQRLDVGEVRPRFVALEDPGSPLFAPFCPRASPLLASPGAPALDAQFDAHPSATARPDSLRDEFGLAGVVGGRRGLRGGGGGRRAPPDGVVIAGRSCPIVIEGGSVLARHRPPPPDQGAMTPRETSQKSVFLCPFQTS